jgi:hypothetical protein
MKIMFFFLSLIIKPIFLGINFTNEIFCRISLHNLLITRLSISLKQNRSENKCYKKKEQIQHQN